MARVLYKFGSVLGLLFVFALFYSCSKHGNVKWVRYDETYCSDKWEHTVNNEKYKDNIVAYLDKQNIKVLEIEIFIDRPADGCADCSCRTGRRIKCKVKKSDVKEIKRQGFYE